MPPDQRGQLAFSTTAPAPASDAPGPPGSPGAGDATGPRRPNRGAAVAWKVAGGIMLVFALWWGIYTAVTVIAHDEYTEVTTFAVDDVDSLMVGTSNGRVTVTAADTDEVTVTANVSDGLRKTGNRQEIIGGELQLDGSCPVLGSQWCSVDYTVELPAELDVRVDTSHGRVAVRGMRSLVDIESNHGSVDVDDVVGDVRLDVSHGSITGSRISAGEVNVRSNHGSIDLQLVEVPDLVDAETDHGSLDLAIPDTPDSSFSVDIATDHGSETTAIRTDPDSDRTIRAVTNHGDVTVRYAG